MSCFSIVTSVRMVTRLCALPSADQKSGCRCGLQEVNLFIVSAWFVPHMLSVGRSLAHTAGRSGCPNSAQGILAGLLDVVIVFFSMCRLTNRRAASREGINLPQSLAPQQPGQRCAA